MTQKESKVFTRINLVVSLQGIVYLYFKYFNTVNTDYGLRPHQYTAHLLHMHILLVPSLLVLFGYFLKIHIIPKLSSNSASKKKSGYSLIVFFGLMSLSGYLLQFGLELKNSIRIGYFHSILSLLWLVMILWHSRIAGKK